MDKKIIVNGKVLAIIPFSEHQDYIISQITSNMQYDNLIETYEIK